MVRSVRLERWATAIAFGIAALIVVLIAVSVGVAPGSARVG